MKVELHQSTTEISQLIEKAKRPRLRQRLRIIALALDGLTAEQVAERTKSSRRRVQEWVARWNRKGVAGLADQSGRGPKLPLDAAQQAQLKQRLDAGPRTEDGVCTLRGEDVRRILHEEFGVGRSLAAVYYLLHRLGYASLAPRPQHRRTDPARQDRFLKKSCPSDSRKFAASGLTSGC
jgi:transposase